MSEPVLKTIIKLFAIVAKEDQVTAQEKHQIEAFLLDHLNKDKVQHYLQQFDKYSLSIMAVDHTLKREDEQKRIEDICRHINKELTTKQKVVILLELIGIILADGHISKREKELVDSIRSSFNISTAEINLIEAFVTSEVPEDFKSKHILIIDDLKTEENGLSHHFSRPGLNGFIAILHMAKADTYFIKYIGTSEVYLNGVPLKPGKIIVFAIGSTIRSEKMIPVYYGDVISQFIKTHTETRISFQADNISFKFKSGKIGLRNIQIAEESGKLIGLMGASGAGKSTLLHVLNGNEAPSEGEVLINNINIHKNPKEIEGVLGFVPQDDLLIDELTVYQNLYYAAKLCFAHTSENDLEKLVLKTLDNLGLTETKNLKVGSPLEKTISGGQRKRLNIGLELLREPSVLFVDEPTSGLSSRDSENIMDLLKELSLKGKLVFVVIHQPSSDIFKMFDKLIILDTGGYQIYYGNPVEAVVYFKENINLINSEEGECRECGNVNPEQIFNIIETKVINEYGNFTNERKVSPEQWNQLFGEKVQKARIKLSTQKPNATLNIPNRFKQLKLFTTRDVLSKLSNKQYLIINLLEAPVLALILAYIVRYSITYHTDSPIYAFSQNINIPAYLFMSIIVALFMGLTVSAEEIIRDRKILKREAFLHLSRSSYLFSKITILFTLSAIQTFTFVIIGNLILEIEGMLLIHWLILFSTSCFANVMGLNISSAFNSAVTIYILIPILLIPQLLLSGVVVKFDKLNPDLSHTGEVPVIGDLMASRWAFEASMVGQFRDNQFEQQFYPYEKVMAEADYKKIYYIPTLETKLEYNLSNFHNQNVEIQRNINNNLTLLSNEIQKELKVVGVDKFNLNILTQKFDSSVYRDTQTFLEKLRTFYNIRYNKADLAKDKLVTSLTGTSSDRDTFETNKRKYHNETIAEIVKNQNEQHRIIENDNELIQKIFPIYKEANPEHILDYRTQFYVPTKYFMGLNFDTVYFNIVVIWLMSLVLFCTLYTDLLRRLIEAVENMV